MVKIPPDRYTIDVEFTSEDIPNQTLLNKRLVYALNVLQGKYDIREYIQCYEMDVHWTSFVALGKEHELPFAGASNWNPHDDFDPEIGLKVAMRRALGVMLDSYYNLFELSAREKFLLLKIVSHKFRYLRWEKLYKKEVKNG